MYCVHLSQLQLSFLLDSSQQTSPLYAEPWFLHDLSVVIHDAVYVTSTRDWNERSPSPTQSTSLNFQYEGALL